MGSTDCDSLKPDHNSIRICGGYRYTANKTSKLEQYLLHKVDGSFSLLAGGITFTKMKMSQLQAYQQLVAIRQLKGNIYLIFIKVF